VADAFVHRPSPATLFEAAQALNSGDLTAVALCEQLVARQQEIDGVVNGYRAFDAASILAQAQAADDRRAAGNAIGMYDGLPIAIKDNISVDGQTCGCASQILEGYTARYDATVVDRLTAAGMICAGRTNMDEFAMGSSTENSAYGPTRNPWNSDYVPGGSSGGSAATVASGQALAALGSDTGGSIRQPASFCGIVGLKPTYGLVSRYGLVAYASSLDQIGPLTADVRDAAVLLDIISGHDKMDSTSLPDVPTGYVSALDEGVDGLRIGVPKEYFDVDGLADDVRAGMDRAIEAYRSAGCCIVDVSLPTMKYAVAAYYVIATAEASSNLARYDGIRYGKRFPNTDMMSTYLKTREQGFGKEVKRRIILGTYVLSSGYYDAYYLRAQKVRTLIRRDFTSAFESCDVILGPVSPTTAFQHGAMSDPLEMYLTDIYTVSVNLAGNCGVSVPYGTDGNGMPIGVQLIGNALGEKAILRAGHWLMSQT
jgi:aspartyl-tRNA(Asn)/glutamyl-tRNA(Gln) amidotransferase subunit A